MARLLIEAIALAAPQYAVIDAARDYAALSVLREAGFYHVSLYDGDTAIRLAKYAPYLVSLPSDPQLLGSLLKHWGESWGVFAISPEPLEVVRSHLRKFLYVQDAGGKVMYFRFYDPRVLRVFLPACQAREAQQFFGPIQFFLCEGDEKSKLLVFRVSAQGAERVTTQVDVN